MKKISSKNKEIAIQLVNVVKKYQLYHEKPTFAEKLIHKKKQEIFTALNSINLTVFKGERLGIMGPNGSGKTTLLKIIAGITTPNEGTVITNGKVISLIDIAAGFHPELTGEENIYLNGLLIGMSKKEISKKYKKIIAFADIGAFIDAPLYTYSSGMILRLGFSVAIHSDPDILLLDEGIVVGDENFQKKVNAHIQMIFKQKKTMIIVSHWKEFLEKNCTRIITINDLKKTYKYRSISHSPLHP